MATITKETERHARLAKKLGYSREKAERLAPNKSDALRSIFLNEFDRYKPRQPK